MKLISGKFIQAIVIILSIYSLVDCKRKHVQEKPKLSATKPWRQDVSIDKAYVARVQAIQHIELRAFEKGYLTNIYVDEGKLVKKGQKMFQIMPVLVKAEYEKAKAEYDASQIEFENTEMLFKEKVVSQTEYALAKARLKKNQAAMELAKRHLELTSISAPFTGIMDKFNVRLGSFVEEGALLTTLSDISQLWIYFNVSEKDYLNFVKQKREKGQNLEVRFIMANREEFPHKGVADTIEGEFDSATGTIPFRATFPNPEGLLRHGETGNIVITEKIPNALVIPQKATFEALDKRYVYTVDAQGTLSAKEVTISHEIPHLFVISEGLTEENVILIEGLGKVNNGESVEIQIEPVEVVMKNLQLQAH
ncbi:MAG: efflux RND transporter periplasmic adaptor subunit [Leptospiraceae bacterium]|nr:efflux RND transporter periplasmic adaptor subunit [Leptospiraceae bacterium]